MTLRELLNEVKFTDLVSPLIKIDEEAVDNLYSFKEAFDLLRSMWPQKSDGIDIEVSMYGYENEEKYLGVYFKVHTDWEIMLSRQVVVSEECNVTKEEIVAIILWEITYWGFSPDEEEDFFSRLHNRELFFSKNNPYTDSYCRLEKKHHDLNCRYKRRHRYGWLLVK